MAKRSRKSKRSTPTPARRDARVIARRSLPLRSSVLPLSGRRLSAVVDRRLFRPGPVTKLRDSRGAVKRTEVLPRRAVPRAERRRRERRLKLRFPEVTPLCVRRERRKEVLHAKRVAGRSGLRRGEWSPFSFVSCKR